MMETFIISIKWIQKHFDVPNLMLSKLKKNKYKRLNKIYFYDKNSYLSKNDRIYKVLS